MSLAIKTGIMGGTFNPIHFGHLLLAEEAADLCGLNEVLFMPSGNPYMKKEPDEVLSGQIRAAMTSLAIADNPRFILSEMEIHKKGPSYTCETIKQLHEEHPEKRYYFILGADSLFSIDKWNKPEEIFKGCSIIAAPRGNKSEQELMEKALFLKEKYHAEIYLLPDRRIDLSSSEIRDRLLSGKSVRYMIPLKVVDYILKNHLYQIPEE